MLPDKVFLASKSPRRLELLSFCFENVEQIQNLREEPRWNQGENPENYLSRCMEVKSVGAEEAYLRDKAPGLGDRWALVLAADTFVILAQEIFGKPEGPSGAFSMLSRMMGREHTVLTGYTLSLYKGPERRESYRGRSESRVSFRKATRSEILAYVRSGEPLDKSGSYGVQGPALQFVSRIEGSYQGVMGIPLFPLLDTVERWKKKYRES